jgi:eukaryotic-like serine/threonine-protein kinase
MAHEVLAGEVPWKSKNEALGLVASILTQPAPSLRGKVKGLPAEVDTALARCLSKSPGDRFGSMEEVIAALQGAGADGPAGRSPASATSSDARPPGDEGAARTTGQRRYSDDEVRKIVERATELQGGEGALSHPELLDVAREVGLDEGAVSAAAREIAREKKAATRGDVAAGGAGGEPAAPPPALQKTSRTAQRWRDSSVT